MVLLVIVILGIAAFCFCKGYILAGVICLAGFSGKYGWPALIFTSIYLFYKGNFIIGILPIVLIVWNVIGLRREILLNIGKKREDGVINNWITLVHESYKYGKKGEYWKSIELAKKALELNPRASEAWRLIGNAYEFLGDEMEQANNYEQVSDFHKKATEAWKKAKEIDPKTIIPGYHE